MSTSQILKNVWYLAFCSKDLKVGQIQKRILAGHPVMVGRQQNGQAFALRDVCPHRGIPLSYGKMVGDQVQCPYHGWKFDNSGVCAQIPSLCATDDLDPQKIRVRHYPLQEIQGNIWIFIGDKDFSPELAPPIPVVPGFASDALPQYTEVAHFPCPIDHAVIGLMDPAHGPFVHQSWFWRSSKTIHEKQKKFAPIPFGFQMVRHQPSTNSRAYKILGGQPVTEISFYLPCVRIEHVSVGKKSFCAMTGLSPIDESNTRVIQLAYWDMPWLTLIKPLIRKFTKVFLYQDLDAVRKQQEGLKFDPSLMLIKDADTQAKWYYALKDEWMRSQLEKSTFKNPVPETTLRWRS